MRHGTPGWEDGSSEMKRLGAQLKALREAQGLTYDDVAAATHVRPHIIRAIESGTIEDIAVPVYARGFVKTYCEYLMASDLWKKYTQDAPPIEEAGEPVPESSGEPVDIMRPTPIFRRSSIIWVYIILVIAVLGAAYLLWRQQIEQSAGGGALPQRSQNTVSSEDEITLPDSGDLSLSASLDSMIEVSRDVLSADILPIPEPQSRAVSPDIGVTSGSVSQSGLSWMDETSVSVRPVVEMPQIVDRTLLIEITGSNRLVVEQDGKVVTRRTLGIGGRRSYDVSKVTKVTISAGNKARVTWMGKRYDSVGSDNSPIVLTFSPDGHVTLESGKSPHFTQASAQGNG